MMPLHCGAGDGRNVRRAVSVTRGSQGRGHGYPLKGSRSQRGAAELDVISADGSGDFVHGGACS
jgi:hypothetical protein